MVNRQDLYTIANKKENELYTPELINSCVREIDKVLLRAAEKGDYSFIINLLELQNIQYKSLPCDIQERLIIDMYHHYKQLDFDVSLCGQYYYDKLRITWEKVEKPLTTFQTIVQFIKNVCSE